MSDEYSYLQFRFLCTMLLFHLALVRANTVSINSLHIAEAYSLLRSSSIHEWNKFGYFYENPVILKLVLLLLLLSGDIERYPGLLTTYTQILRIIQSKENYLKYVHLNFQDIQKKQNGLEKFKQRSWPKHSSSYNWNMVDQKRWIWNIEYFSQIS